MMHTLVRPASISAALRRTRFLGVLLVALLWMPVPLAWGQDPAEITSAVEVRNLNAGEAEAGRPVRLRGVVTFFDEVIFGRFIQDDTAGIYLRESTNTPTLFPGQVVEVLGVTSPGEYAPIVVPQEVRIVGEAPLPEAKPASFEQLASGQEDSQFVEISGIVRSARLDEVLGYHLVELATGGGRLVVFIKDIPVAAPEDLVESRVRVRGVCSTIFNRQRQLFNIRLVVPWASDLVIETPAVKYPFQMPVRTIGSLLQFTPQGSYGRRVKVQGTVTLQQPGTALFIQDTADGLYVKTHQQTPLEVGDVVEVVGFPAQGDYTPSLEDAVYRKIGPGPKPQPDPVDVDEVLKGTHDCRLVRLQARVLDQAEQGGEEALVLDGGDLIFQALLANAGHGDNPFANVANGSIISVTGVCLIDPGEWEAGAEWRAASFRLLLRSPQDMLVLMAPSWWTLEKLLWMVGILAVVILVAMTWVLVLRRRVHQQTKIIRHKLEVEGELKERYVDLFENANDMVFTHDLQGRMTSINKAGERLLHRTRQEILSLNLADLLAEEQRDQAHKWIEQVVADTEVPSAEWDFLDSGGRRIRLELSSRQVDRGGRVVEVEGIARDITQRKRLERELLDISSREQRRIGHDLHDGVCQQLAGISLLTNTLAERLQAGDPVDPGQVEKISLLINEANRQTRSVARGLFPVRLEDNGLVSALEELANDSGDLFKIHATFSCAQPEPIVENTMSLHLYYIAQEALMNAAKHGQAQNVIVELQPSGDRWSLSISDDGVGFSTSFVSRTGMGIRIMHYRARVIGASLDLKSASGSGTQVTCLFSPGAH
jgi:PAS domain S-box-containing protein